MAMLMAPPQLPAFSLRVQLFATNAYSGSDKPIRCFRVVTPPDVSIREFCEEVSRYHEINYGHPIAIKKCQDEEQFDVTQSEILGNLFGNTATIRIVQASILPGIRDSVPPTSALRYDPSNAISRKRQREDSAVPNSSARSSSRKPNKRQRLGTIDPDRPLPSRESDHDNDDALPKHPDIPNTVAVPDSQKAVTSEAGTAHSTTSRHVPADPLQIPETPSPSPAPASGDSSSGDRPTSKQDPKTTILDIDPDMTSNMETTAQAQVSKSPRAKSTSYHIQRTTERGASVSTAATTPLAGEDKITRSNGAGSDKNQKSLDLEPKNGRRNERRGRRSENEDSLYDDVPSDSETAAIMALKRASLRSRKGRASGLPGLDFANGKLKTPPNRNLRSSGSGSRERPLESPGELQLTPNSKQREEKVREASRRQKQEAEEARKARLAAAQRRQEEAQISEAKSRRGEEERIKAEESTQREAQQKEREEKERLAEEERLRKEKLKAEEEQRKEERIAEERAEAERLEREHAQAKEAERVRKVEEARIRREKMAAANEAKKAKVASSPQEAPAHSSATKGKPTSASRSRSSTPFIPPGRKSALKTPLFSSQAVASSPLVQSRSPDAPVMGVGIEDVMPLPKDKNRRISFADGTKQETPIKPSPRILPPKISALRPSTPTPKTTTPRMPQRSTPIPTSAPKTPTPKVLPPRSSTASTPATLTPKPPSQAHRIFPPQWNAPILPPGRSRLSKERSATPASAQKAPAPQDSVGRGPPAMRPPPARRSQTPIPPQEKITPTPTPKETREQDSVADTSSETSSEEEIPSRGSPAKESKSMIPPPGRASAVEISSDDSEEDVPAKVSPAKAAATVLRTHSKSPATPDPASEDEQDDDEEMASNPSSARESRSPVVFSQHPRHFDRTKPQRSTSQESDRDSESEDKTSDSAEESDVAHEDVEDESEEDVEMAEVSEGASEEEDGASELNDDSGENEETAEVSQGTSDEESEVAEGASSTVPKSSPPVLPVQRHSVVPGPKISNHPKSKDHIADERSDTQEEIDQQLTSSMYEARPRGLSSSPPNAPSSTASRPTIKFGASLQSLNSKKPIFGSSTTNSGVKSSQSLQKTLAHASDSEEESEEESDEDSSSSEEEDNPQTKYVAPASTPASKSGRPAHTSDSDDSDSNDSSDSDSGSSDETTRMRNQLAAQIAGIDGSIKGSQYSIASPKVMRNSTARGTGTPNTGGKTQVKKKDKYVSGYVFSQPI
ncbi:uncharacterized protein BP5553_00047 [Venustampulla echinocandica]|uniref:Nucleolar protein Dnt1-like N-terminal domain-containing protein n=1 Tax=Venustampulla echinocandica TaxID=2656787 RepID=A0A370TX62_9HELO|nr:uncharacterized protein BP5553_00047 [Venustampulla echinocandica]RDL40068.1 hypothetical protein BP5553_00047 [Venustampulla echinocandica]